MPSPKLTPEALGEALRKYFDTNPDALAPPLPNGPVARVVDRFGHLPECTREWLEQMRAEDVDDWRQAMRVYRNVRVVWGFVRGVAVSVGGAFMAVVAIGKAFPEITSWLKGLF